MIRFRAATLDDADLYFSWANDAETRNNSYNQAPIPYESHINWFSDNIHNCENIFLVFYDDETHRPIGQVRFMKAGNESVISVSVDKDARGKGMGTILIKKASGFFHEQHPGVPVIAYIKKENVPSVKSFLSAGYEIKEECSYKGSLSYKAVLYA
jgi:UDP-2,4-diacetamido-2,4,6-trideoxy-beta-L-altropyranose hydrolase